MCMFKKSSGTGSQVWTLDTKMDRQTEGDTYEPTVHEHMWAQKLNAMTSFFECLYDNNQDLKTSFRII